MLIKEYKIAKYLRLSREDDKDSESQSIGNQREFINNFIYKNDELKTCVSTEYVDDGYSGTDMERPKFQQMLKDIDTGLINCIIAKDLSRLGRNYIDVGEFINHSLHNNVRIIAVNSNFDSFNSNYSNIELSFTNLYNQYYAKDLSKKVMSSKINKMKNGEFLGPYAILGYEKSKVEKNKLVIDKVSCEYIKLIFKLALEGYSNLEIAKILNDKNIPTPSMYKKSQGILHFSSRKVKNNFWNRIMVLRILNDERYTGKQVSYRYKVIKTNKKIINQRPKYEWIITPNSHEAIISEKDFYKILKIRNDRIGNKNNANIFINKIICPYCNYSMEKVGKRETAYYKCKTYKLTKKFNCNDKKVLDIKIRELIVSSAKILLQSIVDENIMKSTINKQEKNNIKDRENEIIEIKKYVKKSEEEIAKNYLNYLSEKITKDEFITKKNEIMNILNSQNQEEKSLAQDIKSFKTKQSKTEKLIEIYSSISDVESLTKEKVNLLIDKIYIYSEERIEIVWFDK